MDKMIQINVEVKFFSRYFLALKTDSDDETHTLILITS